MLIQDLPIELFKMLLRQIAPTVGLEAAMRLRLVSSTYMKSIIDSDCPV